MANALIMLFYLIPFAVILWLIKRFIDLVDDVRYLANQARQENGDELPQTSRWIAVVAVVLIVVVVVYVVLANTNTYPLSLG